MYSQLKELDYYFSVRRYAARYNDKFILAGFPRNTTKVLLGSIIYMTFSTIATLLQWSDQLKLIMSALFVAALVLSNMLDKKGGRIRG